MRSGVGKGPTRRAAKGPATRCSLRRVIWRSDPPNSWCGRRFGIHDSVIIGLPAHARRLAFRRSIEVPIDRPPDAAADVLVQPGEFHGKRVIARDVERLAMDERP